MKKALSVILALVMCLSLWACSEDVPDTTTNSTENDITISGTDTTPSPSEDATVPSTTEPTTPPTETEPTTPPTETEPTAPPTETEPPATEPPTTAPTEDNTEKQARYEHALTLLEASTTDYTAPSALVKEAYDILSEMGGYKDADKYLRRITIIPDVCLRLITTNTFGEITSQYPRGYDATGQMIWFFDHSDIYNPVLFSTYTFDEKGRIISQTTKYKDGTTGSVKTYQYDDVGNMITETTVNSSGRQSVTTHEYDDTGRRIKTIYDQYDHGYDEYTYDDHGNLIERYGRYDTNDWKETYTYDEFGNIIKISGTIPGNSAFETITEYSYDNSCVVFEKEYEISDGNMRHEREFKYVYGDYYCYTSAE